MRVREGLHERFLKFVDDFKKSRAKNRPCSRGFSKMVYWLTIFESEAFKLKSIDDVIIERVYCIILCSVNYLQLIIVRLIVHL